jgi:hypothetical protein
MNFSFFNNCCHPERSAAKSMDPQLLFSSNNHETPYPIRLALFANIVRWQKSATRKKSAIGAKKVPGDPLHTY